MAQTGAEGTRGAGPGGHRLLRTAALPVQSKGRGVLLDPYMARLTRLERVTSSSAGKRSNPLSYRRTNTLWRRERDSNPRGNLRPPRALAMLPLRPLGYPSARPTYSTTPPAILQYPLASASLLPEEHSLPRDGVTEAVRCLEWCVTAAQQSPPSGLGLSCRLGGAASPRRQRPDTVHNKASGSRHRVATNALRQHPLLRQ